MFMVLNLFMAPVKSDGCSHLVCLSSIESVTNCCYCSAAKSNNNIYTVFFLPAILGLSDVINNNKPPCFLVMPTPKQGP